MVMAQQQFVCLVCGYNYVADYADWWREFKNGSPFGGF